MSADTTKAETNITKAEINGRVRHFIAGNAVTSDEYRYAKTVLAERESAMPPDIGNPTEEPMTEKPFGNSITRFIGATIFSVLQWAEKMNMAREDIREKRSTNRKCR